MKRSGESRTETGHSPVHTHTILYDAAEDTIDRALTRIYRIYGPNLTKFFEATQQEVDPRKLSGSQPLPVAGQQWWE